MKKRKKKVKMPPAVLEQFRKFGSMGGKAQKKKYTKKQLTAWASQGTPAREAGKK